MGKIFDAMEKSGMAGKGDSPVQSDGTGKGEPLAAKPALPGAPLQEPGVESRQEIPDEFSDERGSHQLPGPTPFEPAPTTREPDPFLDFVRRSPLPEPDDAMAANRDFPVNL
ncbi:MAG: hypothetical protein MI863_04720, partial [Desulfobacterales bacterium]|nr:hypothetical protein [Desulfobacterales bacterium]